MSNDAITLLHYASNAAHGCADDSDRLACWWSARAWAAHEWRMRLDELRDEEE